MTNLDKDDLKRLSEKYKDVKLKGGINQYLEKLLDSKSESLDVISLKEIMEKHNITRDDIAMIFGYANTHSYNTSKAKDKMNKGLELFYHLIMKNG